MDMTTAYKQALELVNSELQAAFHNRDWDHLQLLKQEKKTILRMIGPESTETLWNTRVELSDNGPELMGHNFDDPRKVWLDETLQHRREQNVHEDVEENHFELPDTNWEHLVAEKRARINLFTKLELMIKTATHSTPRDLYKVTRQVRKQLRVMPWTRRGKAKIFNLALTLGQKAQLNTILEEAWKANGAA